MPSPSSAGSAVGGAISGAGVGATVGSVIPVVGTAVGALIGGGLGAIGGLLTGEGTADAQQEANRVAAQNAATQSAQAFQNYLSSRGVNLQQVLAADPRGAQFWQNQYQNSVAKGDRRDFNTWLVAALQAAPADPIWDTIAHPTASTGAQNTTLPDYVQIGGQAAQPVIADQAAKLFQGQQATNQAAQAAAISKSWQQSGGANLINVWNAEPDAYAKLYGTFDNFVLADYNANATPEQKSQIQGAATAAAGGVNPQVLTEQQKLVNQNITNLLSGTNLNTQLTALQPALDARTQAAALQQKLIDEQRGANQNVNAVQLGGLQDLLNTRTAGAGNIFDASTAAAHGISDASLTGLANLLSTRTTGANSIYDALLTGSGGIRDAQQAGAHGISDADLAGIAHLLSTREQGAKDIYGADLLSADTYAQSAQQALSRQLAEQAANRARQGFIGTSSGSDLERARLMAQYLQLGAGARGEAGVRLQQGLAGSRTENAQLSLKDAVDLATALAGANTGYATNVANAGTGRATSIAGANEQDSLGRLQTGVNLATSLGGAGTTQATSLAQANEQAAAGRLGANTQLATSNAGLLNTNADIAKQQAVYQNAMDRLNAIIAGQKDQLTGSGLPNANASSTLAVNSAANQSIYDQLNALQKTLSSLTINNAGGPAVTTSTPGSVINGNQLGGGFLTNLGTAFGSSSSAADLMKIIGALGGSNNSGGGGGSGGAANPYPLGQTPVFMGNSKPTF